MERRPETIDNAWHRLYQDYPEVYEAFASFPYDPTAVDVVDRAFPLAGKTVVDIGSGTGRSTLALARYAAHVTGVEPEGAMRRLAEQRLAAQGLANVAFVAGHAGGIPLPDEAVDVATAFTAPMDLGEALRVLRPGGTVVRVDVAPGWYGGDLNDVIGVPTPELAAGSRFLVEECGFAFMDFDSIQEYGSTADIVRTYGFIFGRNAIDHLRRTGKTSIRWRFRLHHRAKERPERDPIASSAPGQPPVPRR